MNIIDINEIRPPGEEAATFQGPKKHRHPYEETFVILDGEIEVIVPANTWHEFKNMSNKPVHMVNIHPVPKMITEWA